jgi:hypothetical protein
MEGRRWVKLKRLLAVLLLVFLLAPSMVLANSTPVYMENYPGFNIAPMKDTPIKVDREHLLFQIDERCLGAMPWSLPVIP